MSIMLNLNSSLLKLTLCLLFAKIVISSDSVLLESSVQEPRENTRTHLVSVTMHATSTGVCVKLVNVTGACLRRRGVWVEEPIVLTFDDEMEGEVDMLYTPVLGIEETKLPEGMDGQALRRSTREPDISSSVSDFSGVSPKQAQQSMFTRFFAWLTSGLTGLFGANPQGSGSVGSGGGSPGNPSPQTVTQIQIETQTHTHTSTVTEQLSVFHTVFLQTTTLLNHMTHYNTIFVQRCTPSPFPFTLCPSKSES